MKTKTESVSKSERVITKSAQFDRLAIIFHSVAIIAGLVYLSLPWTLWIIRDIENADSDVEQVLISADDQLFALRFHEVNCSEKGYRNEQLLGSAPNHCGVLIDDSLIDSVVALKLREIVEKSIKNFGYTREEAPENVNIKRIKLFEFVIRGLRNRVIAESDFELIKHVSEQIKKSVSSSFGIQEKNLFFTPICEATRFKPIVAFQEFRHVDKVRSPPLVVTSIIWLSTHGQHFNGGRLHFLFNNSLLIEPKLGRFAAWSSSYECPHEVQELISGERYALLFAFTVDADSGHHSIDEMRNWYSSRV